MLEHPFLIAFRTSPKGNSLCTSCQRRSLFFAKWQKTASGRRLSGSARPDRHAQRPSDSHRNGEVTKEKKEKKNDEELRPLGAPIGLESPPVPGQNSGRDDRTLRQKWKDFPSNERHKKNREEIITKLFRRSYLTDFKSVRYHGGKTFLSNPRLFRAAAALYFPNLSGTTLASSNALVDTTRVLWGKVSVVNVYSSMWGENQIGTFMDDGGVRQLLAENADMAQRVRINVEENWVKAMLVRLFSWRLRNAVPREEHGRFFVVRRGITDRIRYAIGLLNGRVGYVYLLDRECRIRWAGSGDALPEEKESLVKGLKKLIDEERECTEKPVTKVDEVNEELEAQVVAAGAS